VWLCGYGGENTALFLTELKKNNLQQNELKMRLICEYLYINLKNAVILNHFKQHLKQQQNKSIVRH